MRRNCSAIGMLMSLALIAACERAPDTLLERAESLCKSGDWNSAIELCNEHLALAPEDGNILVIRGRAYHALGQYSNAIDDFTTMIQANPNDCDPYYRRGLAYEAIGNTELAKADREMGRQLDPYRASASLHDSSLFANPSSGGSEKKKQAARGKSTKESDERLTDEAPEEKADDVDALDRELENDYYHREDQRGAGQMAGGNDSDSADDHFITPARRRIREGTIDQDFVRDSMRAFRDSKEEEDIREFQPHLPRILPRNQLSLDDIVGPVAQPAQDPSMPLVDGDGIDGLASPLSTAIPPSVVPMGINPTMPPSGMVGIDPNSLHGQDYAPNAGRPAPNGSGFGAPYSAPGGIGAVNPMVPPPGSSQVLMGIPLPPPTNLTPQPTAPSTPSGPAGRRAGSRRTNLPPQAPTSLSPIP